MLTGETSSQRGAGEAMMRAVVLPAPNGIDALEWTSVPRPVPVAGEALVRVLASSAMSADLPTLDGVSVPGPGLPGPTYPMTPGNELVGEVFECPGGEFPVGQKVAVGFGGYGFTRDGGQAEFALVSCRDLWPFETEVPWEVAAALPKAFGSAEMVKQALQWKAGDVLLIRGGSTAIALAIVSLSGVDGVSCIGTTRDSAKVDAMLAHGYAEVIVDEGDLLEQMIERHPEGVDLAVEMLGYPQVRETLRCVRPGGTVCMVGILAEQAHSRAENEQQDRTKAVAPSPQWFVPAGVRLTTAMQNGTTVMKVPDPVLNHMQTWLDLIAEGRIEVPVQAVLPMSCVAEAYHLLEEGTALGRIVLAVPSDAENAETV